MSLNILKYDDIYVSSKLNKTAFLLDKTEYSEIGQKEKLDPSESWTVPFLTGHKYKIHFGVTGINFENINF